VNDDLILINYDALFDVYDDVYGHAFDNGQFSTIFLKGWLAQHKGHPMNWTEYAFDCTQLQMKKASK
jgi:hypothetical protein